MSDPNKTRLAVLLIGLSVLRLAKADLAAPPLVEKPAVASTIPQTAPSKAEWDSDVASMPDKFLAREWPTGDVLARIEVNPAGKAMNAGQVQVKPGQKNLHVVVKLSNPSAVRQRVILSGLRLMRGKADVTSQFFVLPLSSLPGLIPPHGQAQQEFRLDTFNDIPTAIYTLEPVVLCVTAPDDLLSNGGFDEVGKIGKPAANQKTGWTLPLNAPDGLTVSAVKAGIPLAELSNRIADWTDYTKLSFVNNERFATQGSGLLEASAPSANVITEQTVTNIKPGERYAAGIDSWNGNRMRVEILDAKNAPLASEERNFSGFFFHDNVANWRGRVLGFRTPQGASGVRFSLLAPAGKSWWDNGFLVPERALRQAVMTPRALEIASGEAKRTGDVVYLGEDRDTKGNWIGKYGQYAYILCAMSAPRDMVGGYAKPLKCDYRDMSKVYNNETIRVRGKGELRYAAWTGNPQDAQPRHWIDLDAMRTDEERALENPQWGYRTSASWDDHGETHPTDAWGNDFYIRLRLPVGSWRVSYYFLDWNWFASPNARNYRLQFLNNAGDEVCTARALDLGQGVYKVFRVEGGKDVVLRIRKDFTINSIIPGIFIDPLSPKMGPSPTVAGVTGQSASRLASVVQRWRLAAETANGFAAEDSALREYRNILMVERGRAEAARLLSQLGDAWFADGEYWRAAVAYNIIPQNPTLLPIEAAEVEEQRAIQFRSVFPRYAEAKIHRAVAILTKLPETERIPQLHKLASRIFDVAMNDHTESNGMERVPMILAKTAYSELESQVKYSNLTPSERAKMLAVAERNTWYTVGWQDVVNEAQRFWPTLTPQQRAKLGPEFFADHVVRPFGVLAQSDHSYLDKVVAFVDDFVKANPKGDDAGFAQYELAEVFYQQGQRDKAIARCEAIVKQRPQGRPAVLATNLLMKLGIKKMQ